MKNKKSRREFLKELGLTGAGSSLLGPSSQAVLGLMGVIHPINAKAQESVKPRRYIHFFQVGAPPRYYWDLFLTPFSDAQGFVPNKQLGTRYTGGSNYTSVEYKTWQTTTNDGRKINLPWIWQFSVPKAGGGERPMTDLLPNMLQIRGIDTFNNGHQTASIFQHFPLGSSKSINALSADHANAPIAAINASAEGYTFKSLKGHTAVKVSHSRERIDRVNMISDLLSPFKNAGYSSFKDGRTKMDSLILNAQVALDNDFVSRDPSMLSVKNSNKSVAAIKDKLSNINTNNEWTRLTDKYNDLITRALDPNRRMAGINDRPIGASSKGVTYNAGSGKKATNSDLRSMITNNTQCKMMAASFATAEFAMMNDLTYSITLPISNLGGLNIGGTTSLYPNDEHAWGGMPSLLINTFFNIAFSACLLEFFDQLKGHGIFDDSVVRVSGEFGRNPHNLGNNSGHASRAQSVCLYSGAVKEPIIIGDVVKNAPEYEHNGSYGYQAQVKELGAYLDIGFEAVTIAKMLRVPPPLTAKSSLVREVGGKIIPLIPSAREVT